MERTVVEFFEAFLLHLGFALRWVLSEVHQEPRLFASGVSAQPIVVLIEPMLGVGGESLVVDLEGRAVYHVCVEHWHGYI